MPAISARTEKENRQVSVAAVIGDRPTCAALIERITLEAEETLARLAPRS